MRWVAWRDGVLLGMRPDPSHVSALVSCDQALQAVRFSFLLHYLLLSSPLYLADFETRTLR